MAGRPRSQSQLRHDELCDVKPSLPSLAHLLAPICRMMGFGLANCFQILLHGALEIHWLRNEEEAQ